MTGIYVIAEAGSNHNDNLKQALKLVVAAANTGADAVKFQLYRADELYPGQHTPHALPDEWLPILQNAARECGIDFLCSVFSPSTLDAYLEIGPTAVKIASPELTDAKLLTLCADAGLHVYLSTGMSTVRQVDEAACRITYPGGMTLLHCVSSYPAPSDEMNLAAITWLRERYGFPVGLSDHSLDADTAPVMAVALGATVIEKHLTLSKFQAGPDHHYALEPAEFGWMVQRVRLAASMRGDGVKRVMPSEDETDRRLAA